VSSEATPVSGTGSSPPFSAASALRSDWPSVPLGASVRALRLVRAVAGRGCRGARVRVAVVRLVLEGAVLRLIGHIDVSGALLALLRGVRLPSSMTFTLTSASPPSPPGCSGLRPLSPRPARWSRLRRPRRLIRGSGLIAGLFTPTAVADGPTATAELGRALTATGLGASGIVIRSVRCWGCF
jgi:hypothetical protein